MIERRILLLLVNVLEVPIISYKLVRLLTRKFEIYHFNKVIDESLNDNYIESINVPSKQMRSYRLTEKGKKELEKINLIDFEMELKALYPDESEFIELLIMRVK